MITTCLDDYIGLQGCGNTTPDSGLYLNDLSGIDLKKIAGIANDEQQNYVGVWNDIQKRALRKFQTDVRVAFLQKYKLKGITQNVNLEQEIDTSTTYGAAAKYRGFLMELNEANDEIVYSVIQAIHIQDIKVYIPSGTPTFNVKVYDLDTGTELWSSSETATGSGWHSVNVNEYFRVRRIFVCYDATSIDSVKLDIEDHELDNCYRCRAEIRGASSSTGTPTTLTEDVYNTFGLSAVVSVRCVWDTLVCNNKEIFAQSLLYRLAIEFVNEWINSDRINRYTLLDEAKAKRLLGYYTALYKGGMFEEVEYESELLTAIENFNLDEADCCIDCSGPITFQDSYI